MRNFRSWWPLVVGVVLGFVVMSWIEATEAQNESSATWSCSLDGIGATLTLCKTATNGGRRLYISTVWAQSTTATAGLMLIRHGKSTATGGSANCGTDTTSLFPSAATVPRVAYPANTLVSPVLTFTTPLEVPPDRDLCVIGTVTNTATVHMAGQVKP